MRRSHRKTAFKNVVRKVSLLKLTSVPNIVDYNWGLQRGPKKPKLVP